MKTAMTDNTGSKISRAPGPILPVLAEGVINYIINYIINCMINYIINYIINNIIINLSGIEYSAVFLGWYRKSF